MGHIVAPIILFYMFDIQQLNYYVSCFHCIDEINSLEYIEIFPHSTISYDFIFGKIKWESSFVDDISIQPPPLCGPTNITNSSVMALLERNGSIVYNISIHQRSCSQRALTSFSLDCPLLWNVPVMKFIIYSNRTMTALSNDNDIVTCDNGIWQNTNTMSKMDDKLCMKLL